MNLVKIRKNGTFYTVFDDDMYIIYYLLNYNIKNDKIGFPKSALGKVTNLLEENEINYEVVGEDIKANFKNMNQYLKFVRLGKDKYNKSIYYENIREKVRNATPEKLDKILSTIESILDE